MAEPTAHTEHPAGHTTFPPFQSEFFPSQLFWLAVSFVLLYVLMSKIALPRIGAIMADRSKRISDDLAAAEQSIASTRSSAMGNVRSIAADTASAIVERLIGKAPADHEVTAALDAGKR